MTLAGGTEETLLLVSLYFFFGKIKPPISAVPVISAKHRKTCNQAVPSVLDV